MSSIIQKVLSLKRRKESEQIHPNENNRPTQPKAEPAPALHAQQAKTMNQLTEADKQIFVQTLLADRGSNVRIVIIGNAVDTQLVRIPGHSRQ
jgi:hypothetical protein